MASFAAFSAGGAGTGVAMTPSQIVKKLCLSILGTTDN